MRNDVENTVMNMGEKQEWHKEIEGLNLQLKKELETEGNAFRDSGFPVDNEFRIDMGKFEGLYRSDVINRNKNTVVSMAKKFEKEFTDPVGELLERAKTLAVNRFWFKARYLAVRTSKFDDYVNGIDELIIHKETGRIIAAVDSTTEFISKAEKVPSILKDGAKTAYGIGLKDERPVLIGEMENLPVFIVSFDKKETIELAKKVAGHQIPEAEEKKLLELLISQAKEFSKNASPKMRPKYDQALKEFQSLKD